jgi:hypothetical protein
VAKDAGSRKWCGRSKSNSRSQRSVSPRS